MIFLSLMILLIQRSSGQELKSRVDFVQALIQDYDNRLQPRFEEDMYTEVDVSLYINNIDSISEKSMDLKMNLLIQQEWEDPRLAFFGLIEAPYLELDSKLISQIWVPDLYIRNEKSASFHSVTVPNKMLHLYSEGRIVYRLRASITASCPMQLHKYPLDSQVCSVYLQSFAFTRNNLRFRWRDHNPVLTNPTLELPQFLLTKEEVTECEKSGIDPNGNFTCIKLNLYFDRRLGFYMIQIYIPTILIVLLSWVSFWLSIDAVPARISLGILTVLTLTNQKSNLASSVPHVSYVKALDIWLAVCLCFVFAAMLEYALVNVMDREWLPIMTEIDQYRAAIGLHYNKIHCYVFSSVHHNNKPNGHVKLLSARRSGARIDEISRYLFPVLFTVFCALYWIIYTV